MFDDFVLQIVFHSYLCVLSLYTSSLRQLDVPIGGTNGVCISLTDGVLKEQILRVHRRYGT